MQTILRQTLLLALVTCGGCRSASNTDVHVENGQSQTQNEPEVNCNVQCNVQTNGSVQVIKDCQGGASTVAVIEALPDNCDSVNEVVPTTTLTTALH
jgi:hypothetical protein